MNTLKAYKLISFILLPFGGILGIISLLAIIMGLMNIAFLFQGAIFSLVVIYIISSFIFLIKVIYQNKRCKQSLRKWIRATGIISLLFSFNILFGSFIYLFKPMALSNAMNEVQNLQKGLPQFDVDFMTSIMKGIFYAMIFFATTLIIHYFETMKFLKVYSASFEKSENQ